MKFDVTLKHLIDGTWQAKHLGSNWLEPLSAEGSTREGALDRLKETIRYHIEYCP